MSDDALLDVRMCDLELHLESTWLHELTERVQGELRDKGLLRFKPHFWLGDEWFSPEKVPGVALPFYLAHPRLVRLERRMMMEVEGGTKRECLRLLRHELGHALHHAYDLHRRRRWQNLFGLSSTPYPDVYQPNPASKRFVQHLDGYYAQSHPDEDFAETFAVWLTPRSSWRKRYAGWPFALEKLEYVDELADELATKTLSRRSRAKPYALSTLKYTLREHYARKRAHYSVGYSERWDADLTKLFDRKGGRVSAVGFIRENRAELLQMVARWTGDHSFTVEQVLKEIGGRCKQLRLRTDGSHRTKVDFAILLAVHSMSYVYRAREWHEV